MADILKQLFCWLALILFILMSKRALVGTVILAGTPWYCYDFGHDQFSGKHPISSGILNSLVFFFDPIWMSLM